MDAFAIEAKMNNEQASKILQEIDKSIDTQENRDALVACGVHAARMRAL